MNGLPTAILGGQGSGECRAWVCGHIQSVFGKRKQAFTFVQFFKDCLRRSLKGGQGSGECRARVCGHIHKVLGKRKQTFTFVQFFKDCLRRSLKGGAETRQPWRLRLLGFFVCTLSWKQAFTFVQTKNPGSRQGCLVSSGRQDLVEFITYWLSILNW